MAQKKKTSTKKASTKPRKKKVEEEQINIDPTNIIDVIKEHEVETKEAVERAEEIVAQEQPKEEPEVVVEGAQEPTTEEESADVTAEEYSFEMEVEIGPKDEVAKSVAEKEPKEVQKERKPKLNPTKVTKAKRLWNYYWNGTLID